MNGKTRRLVQKGRNAGDRKSLIRKILLAFFLFLLVHSLMLGLIAPSSLQGSWVYLFQVTVYLLDFLILRAVLGRPIWPAVGHCLKWSWWSLAPILLWLMFAFRDSLQTHLMETFDIVFLVALPEEIMFRCLFQEELEKAAGNRKGLWICALLFAGGHIPTWLFWEHISPGHIVLLVGELTLMGYFYSYAMKRTGSLVLLVLLHSSWDLRFIPWLYTLILYFFVYAYCVVSAFITSGPEGSRPETKGHS